MFVAVSDDEFTNLLERHCKNAFVAKCEIHGTKKIEAWVDRHGGKRDDKKIYKDDFRALIRSSSREEFNERLIRRGAADWSRPFYDYFMARIVPEVEKFALWDLIEKGFQTTEHSIITSNQ